MVTGRGLMVYNIIFVMNENTRDDTLYEDRMWATSDWCQERVRYLAARERRVSCDTPWLEFTVLWGIFHSFHVLAAAGVSYRNSEDFPLRFSVFWHFSWRIQVRSPSTSVPICKMAWLPHRTSHGVCWNLEICRSSLHGCSGKMKNWFLQTRTDIRISLWSSILFTSNT